MKNKLIDHSNKIFSIDAETNWLLWQAFAVAVTVRENKQEVDNIILRCPIEWDVNPWVQENVITNIEDIDETHNSYEEMLKELYWFWDKYRNILDENWNPVQKQAQVIAHMGIPVESKLFTDMLNTVWNPFAWPYPIDEVATALRLVWENPTSVDTYMKKHNIKADFDWESHHPMYDAVVAAQVWEDITGVKKWDNWYNFFYKKNNILNKESLKVEWREVSRSNSNFWNRLQWFWIPSRVSTIKVNKRKNFHPNIPSDYVYDHIYVTEIFWTEEDCIMAKKYLN